MSRVVDLHPKPNPDDANLTPEASAVFTAVEAVRRAGGDMNKAIGAAAAATGSLDADLLAYARRCYDGDAHDPRRELLERRLGLMIRRIVKRGRQDGRFEIHLVDGGEVDLGTAFDLLIPTRVEARLLDAIGRAPNLGSRQKWRPFAEIIAQLAEPVTTLSEDEEVGQLLADIADDAPRPRDAKELAAHMAKYQTGAWIDQEGQLVVRLTGVSKTLWLDTGVRLGQRELARRLSRLGFERDRVSVADPDTGKIHKARVWIGEIPET